MTELNQIEETTKLVESLLIGNDISLVANIMSFLLVECEYCREKTLNIKVVVCQGIHEDAKDELNFYCPECRANCVCDGCDEDYPDCDDCKTDGYELVDCDNPICYARFCDICISDFRECDICDKRFCCKTMYEIGHHTCCEDCIYTYNGRTPKAS